MDCSRQGMDSPSSRDLQQCKTMLLFSLKLCFEKKKVTFLVIY